MTPATPASRLRWTWLCLLLGQAALADVFSPGGLSPPHASIEGIAHCGKCHPSGDQLSAESCLSCHGELKPGLAAGRGYHGRLGPGQLAACRGCHLEHQGSSSRLVDWGAAGIQGFDHRLTGWPLKGKHLEGKCEKCHARQRIADGAVLKMLDEQPRRVSFLGLPTQCLSCHFDEHRGQLGQLCGSCHEAGQAFKPAPRFDHDQDSRYPLLGRHAQVACKECHPSLLDPETPPEGFTPKSNQYLKMAPLAFRACTDCHKDVHEGKFKQRCESCHTVRSWREIQDLDKDRDFHRKTKYPLKGRHLEAPCASCHGPSPGKKHRLKGLAFGRCADCHPDAHLRQMEKPPVGPGQTCDGCHSVEGFEEPLFGPEQHARTRYPLEHAHRAAACNSCHVRDRKLAEKIPVAIAGELKRSKRPLLVSLAKFQPPKHPERCESCHPDVHASQFAQKQGGCKGCHRLTSFGDLSFDHDRDSRFPLAGKHAKASCGSCHPPERIKNKGVVRYRPLPLTCAGCHLDAHAGQLALAKGPAECGRCHGNEGFKPSKFLHLEPFTRFTLEGKHRDVPCLKCHPALELGEAVKLTRYRPLPTSCAGCHENPHRGELGGLALEALARPDFRAEIASAGEERCESCHSSAGWNDGRFPHEKTGFALAGAHARVSCRSCHPGRFNAPLPRGCAGCHRDPHGGELGARCQGCHEEGTWESRFGADAHRRTSFPLVGRHAALPCEECHGELRERSFARRSVECVSCHLPDYQRTPLGPIDHPRLGMGQECQECHDGWRFSPARFPDHDRCFPLSSGKHQGISCLGCHRHLPVVVTLGGCRERSTGCASCHEHECARSDSRHAGVVGYQCKDTKCYECHKLSSP